MASGADRFFGGDGNNTVSQWLREKSGEQLDNMTPTDVEAMQGRDIEMGTNGLPHLKEGSTWRGFGLNLGGAVGSTLPTMVGGGLAARGFAALGVKALGQKAVSRQRLWKPHHSGYFGEQWLKRKPWSVLVMGRARRKKRQPATIGNSQSERKAANKVRGTKASNRRIRPYRGTIHRCEIAM